MMSIYVQIDAYEKNYNWVICDWAVMFTNYRKRDFERGCGVFALFCILGILGEVSDNIR